MAILTPNIRAANGNSIDPVSGDVVLGNDVGDLNAPASLESDRIVPMQGFKVAFDGGTTELDLVIIDEMPLQVNGQTIELVSRDSITGDIVQGTDHGNFFTDGDGVTTDFVVPLNVARIAGDVLITPLNVDCSSGWYISAFASGNFTISFLVAPVAGSQNVNFSWFCFFQFPT